MTESLVIAPQWIGDAVMSEPLLRRLHARGERLTVAALPWVAPIYRAMPQVAKVIELPFEHGRLQWFARFRIAKTLRGCFACAYVLPNSLKSALIPFFANIPKRVGYQGESRFGLLTDRLDNPPPHSRQPMVPFYSALSAEPDSEGDQPSLSIDPVIVQATLAGLHLPLQGYYVMAPGAEFGPAKRWPAAHFAALARQLQHPVVLLGSAKEAALCAEIAQAVNLANPGHCRDWAGRTTLDLALATIAGAKAMVSNDSGLMHVAAAFGLRQVALFGSSSPLHTPPMNPNAQVVWLKNERDYFPALDCAPCFERVCPLGHTRCLVDIQPAHVLQLL